MRNCKRCAFCKRDLINDYIKDADLYKCDMDGAMILDPRKEGENCAWFKDLKPSRISIIQRITKHFAFRK